MSSTANNGRSVCLSRKRVFSENIAYDLELTFELMPLKMSLMPYGPGILSSSEKVH